MCTPRGVKRSNAGEAKTEAPVRRTTAATAVESYRAARATPWGSALPPTFLRKLLIQLKQRGWRGRRFRLVCAGWRAAHDEQCTRLDFRAMQLHETPATLPRLELVAALEIRCIAAVAEGVLAAHLPKLQALPSLIALKIAIPYRLSPADARALGALTTLTTLTLTKLDLDLTHDGADGDEEMELDSIHLDNLEASSWLSFLSALPRLAALDLSECAHVRIDDLSALGDLTSLTSLALRGQSATSYQLDSLRGEDLVVLDHLELTTLKLVDMVVTDQALSRLAMLRHLKALQLVGCDQVTQQGILVAVRKAAPRQLTITAKQGR
jgi:hypothetical protein